MAPVKRLPGWFKEAKPDMCLAGGGRRPRGFVEKTLARLAAFLTETLYAENFASYKGLLQGIAPHARIAGIAALVAAAALTASAVMLGLVAICAAMLTLASGVSFRFVGKRVAPSFIFTSILILPVFFSFMSPGEELAGFGLNGLRVSLTREGAFAAAFFITRVSVAVWLLALVVATTTHSGLFRGLSRLPVPSIFVTALFLTFRYVFILVRTAEDAALARKSRVIGGALLSESQRWFASRAALILKKSVSLSEDVFQAMSSRGFTGEVKGFRAPDMAGRDLLWIGCTVFVALLSIRF